MPTKRIQRGGRSKRIPVRPDAYQRLQRKMLHETEIGIAYGLRFPDRVPRIPTIVVGCGSFDPSFAERYWIERLEFAEFRSRRRDRG